MATVTSLTELLVGIACLGFAVAVRSRMAVAAALLAVAGLAAAVHAVIELL